MDRGDFMELELFSKFLGYILGLLIIFTVCKIFFKPLKVIFKFFFSSFLGLVLLFIINSFSHITGFYIGINPITALILGLLGVPGIIVIAILKFFIM